MKKKKVRNKRTTTMPIERDRGIWGERYIDRLIDRERERGKEIYREREGEREREREKGRGRERERHDRT